MFRRPGRKNTKEKGLREILNLNKTVSQTVYLSKVGVY